MATTKEFLERSINGSPFGWNYTEESKLGLDHFKFEEIDYFYWHSFVKETWQYSFVTLGVYGCVIFYLGEWMSKRPALNLPGLLFSWNLVIATLAVLGFWRTAPGMWVAVTRGSFYDSVCTKSNADVQIGFWALIYALTKFLILCETVILRLLKKPVSYIHVGHHCLIVLLSWILTPYLEPVSRWVVVLNYLEHAVLYSYFLIRPFVKRIPAAITIFVIMIQLALVICLGAFHIISTYYFLAGYGCDRAPLSIFIGFIVFGCFLYLYYDLFNDKVLRRNYSQKRGLKAQ